MSVPLCDFGQVHLTSPGLSFLICKSSNAYLTQDDVRNKWVRYKVLCKLQRAVPDRVVLIMSPGGCLGLVSLLGSLLGLNNGVGFICRKHLLIIVWFE